MAPEAPIFCATEHGCITCADEGVEVRVVGIGAPTAWRTASTRRACGGGRRRPRGGGRARRRAPGARRRGDRAARRAGAVAHEVRGGVPRPGARPRAGGRDPRVRRARPALQGDGGVRRAHPLHLQVRGRRPPAGQRGAGARPGLPGVRHPDGAGRRRHRDRPRAGRHLHLLRRHDARARAPRGRCSRRRPRAPTCAWSTRRSTPCASPARTPTARSSSSRSASRRPPPPPR